MPGATPGCPQPRGLQRRHRAGTNALIDHFAVLRKQPWATPLQHLFARLPGTGKAPCFNCRSSWRAAFCIGVTLIYESAPEGVDGRQMKSAGKLQQLLTVLGTLLFRGPPPWQGPLRCHVSPENISYWQGMNLTSGNKINICLRCNQMSVTGFPYKIPVLPAPNWSPLHGATPDPAETKRCAPVKSLLNSNQPPSAHLFKISACSLSSCHPAILFPGHVICLVPRALSLHVW